MTDKNLTEIVCIVDRSGSMQSLRESAVRGFNTFLAEQKKLPGAATLTYVQFDHEYDVVHDGKPIQLIPELTADTFVPRGDTALLDAIGRTMNDVGSRLSRTPEDQRPGKVIVVILTDGQENASKEFTRQKILEMINHQRDMYQWEFVYLAANQDAFAVAKGLGIRHASNFMASDQGVRKSYMATSHAVSSYRTTGSVGSSLSDSSEKKP